MRNNIKHNLTDYGLKYDFKSKNIYNRKFIDNFDRQIHFTVSSVSVSSASDTEYFTWSKECEKFYKKSVDWDAVFPLNNLIEFESTHKLIKPVKHYNPHLDEITNTGIEYLEINETEPSGYIVPKYTFVELYPFDSYTSDVMYENALDLFELEKQDVISPITYTMIANYRDTLYSQIERQANKIQNINEEIADVFKVYYYELERAIVLAKMNETQDNKIEKIDTDWKSIKYCLREFYKIIQYKCDPHYIRDSLRIYGNENLHDDWYFQIEKSEYIPIDILDKVLRGYYELMTQKEPILETASLLTERITPLESILEDCLNKRKIKSAEEYTELQSQNNLSKYLNDEYWEIAHSYYYKGMIWEDVYDELSAEMEKAGLPRRHSTFESFKNGKYNYSQKMQG